MTAEDQAHILGPIGELAEHAQLYAAAAYDIFPVNPKNKTPWGCSQYDATTNPDKIRAWWQARPTALIGHLIPEHLLVLDIDPRHSGNTTWRRLKVACGGTWVETRAHASGRGDGGGHTTWLRPEGKISVKGLDEWARAHGVGEAVMRVDPDSGELIDTGRWTSGIDLLHHNHRYTILPPSPHPDTGRPYHWVRDVDPQPMPALLVTLLTADPNPQPQPQEETHPREPQQDSIADWYSDTHTWTQLLTRHGWTQVGGGSGDADGARWKHPRATGEHSATIRHHCLFVYTPNTPFTVTAPSDPAGITLFRAYGVLEHHGDLKTAATVARQDKDGVRGDSGDLSWITPEPETPTSTPGLPDDFWAARPILQHIRKAAWARIVSPDAVLVTVLARVAFLTPHTVRIPAIVGSHTGLTYMVCLVGNPEAGKGAATAVAAELLPARDGALDNLPIGSGEGMVEILFDYVDETGEDGKTKKVKTQVHNNAFFNIDEGQVLADIGGRSGSTLLPTLRSAWSSKTIGNTNASAERRRLLDGDRYAFGIVMGIQPDMADKLLDDAAGGTPQRIVYASATDPQAPEDTPEWPGGITWEPPDPDAGYHEIHHGAKTRHELQIHADIKNELVADRKAVQRGEKVRASLDAHTMLLRLKTAALLALLDGSVVVRVDDWDLAAEIIAASRRVRTTMVYAIAKTNSDQVRARIEHHAEKEITVDQKREARAVAASARAMSRAVKKHAESGEHEGCVRKCLTVAVASRDRKMIDVDDAIAHAVALRWLKETPDDRFTPGSKDVT